MFEVRLSNQAEKAARKAEPKLQQRLREALFRLRENPVPAREFDVKKTAGEEHTYRIRLSDYRIRYTVYWDAKLVRVLKIDRRETAYD